MSKVNKLLAELSLAEFISGNIITLGEVLSSEALVASHKIASESRDSSLVCPVAISIGLNKHVMSQGSVMAS